MPSDWLPLNLEYSGHGHAQGFRTAGTAEGPVSVRCSEFGQMSVEMRVGSITPSQHLLTLCRPDEEMRSDDYVRLSVRCDGGEYVATRAILSGLKAGMPAKDDLGSVSFYPAMSQFDADGAGQAEHWVLPLTNFLMDYQEPGLDLDRHPLRVQPGGRDFVAFEFKGRPAFIEALDGYAERKERLISGREQRLITAVMVGEVAGGSIETDDLDRWFPFDLPLLLGLATGHRVGSPWIEFRDSQGRLVRRLHWTLGRPQFVLGRAAIAPVDRGLGRLLTRAQTSPEFGMPHVRVALKYLIQGGEYGQGIEDSFGDLCCGLDGLCKHYGLTQQNLAATLDACQQVAVSQALGAAAAAIRAAADGAAAAGNHQASSALCRIAERAVCTPAGKDSSFGLSVVALLEKFGFSDAAVIVAHYAANPRADCSDWPGVLSHYRGIALHGRSFNLQAREHDFDDLMRIREHLHDILLRVLLRILGYDGTYEPTVARWLAPTPLDWVERGATANQLGY